MRRVALSSIMMLALSLAACQTTTTRGSAGDDYREDQATRQTERDLAETDKKKTRRPIDTYRQDRQDVIDQPR